MVASNVKRKSGERRSSVAPFSRTPNCGKLEEEKREDSTECSQRGEAEQVVSETYLAIIRTLHNSCQPNRKFSSSIKTLDLPIVHSNRQPNEELSLL